MNDTAQPSPASHTDAVDPFPSISSLRANHRRLLNRHAEIGETPELLDDAEGFIRRGRATGAFLDAGDDRWASQGLLDYWVAVLYRAGREPPDATLTDFDPGLAPELEDTACPYVGLDAFDEPKHQVFFGRQRVIEDLISWLKEERLLTVVGPSGCGKSSVVLAGVLPALKGGAVPGSRDWRYYPAMVPGSNPLANLARLFSLDATDGWIQSQVERFQEDAASLASLITEGDERPAVLVIDQFEELFTLCDSAQIRQVFADNLLRVIQILPLRHIVILTMRADYESHVTTLPEFHEFFETALKRIPPLSAAELREAVVKPAESVGLKFEEGVVDALLGDILGEPTALPLLQFTLLKLWEKRERNRVTWEAYHRLGGGRQALANVADEFYNQLIHEEQATARYILLRMVRPSEGLEVTSNRIRRQTLYKAGPASDRVDRVLGKLLDARLVRLTRGATSDDDQVEIAHEALVRNWPRLEEWLEEERVAMTTRRRLEARAAEWVRLGRTSAGLLDEIQLLEAEHWLDSPDAERLGYGDGLAALVQASRAAVEQASQEREEAHKREVQQAHALAEQQAQSARRLRWLVVVLVAGIIVALSLAGLAVDQKQKADDSAATAIQAQLFAEAAAVDAASKQQVAQDSLATQEAQIISQLQQSATSTPAPATSTSLTTATSTRSAPATRDVLATAVTSHWMTLTAEAASMPTGSATPVRTAGPTPVPRLTANFSATATARALATQLDSIRATQTAIARCPYETKGPFSQLWQREGVQDRLGCPVNEYPANSFMAEQRFGGRGTMYWSERPELFIVLIGQETGSWRLFRPVDITWPWNPDGVGCEPPVAPGPGEHQPVRGFGGLWCANPEIREALQFASAPEQGVLKNLIQEFAGGFILRDSTGTDYILFVDDWTYLGT